MVVYISTIANGIPSRTLGTVSNIVQPMKSIVGGLNNKSTGIESGSEP